MDSPSLAWSLFSSELDETDFDPKEDHDVNLQQRDLETDPLEDPNGWSFLDVRDEVFNIRAFKRSIRNESVSKPGELIGESSSEETDFFRALAPYRKVLSSVEESKLMKQISKEKKMVVISTLIQAPVLMEAMDFLDHVHSTYQQTGKVIGAFYSRKLPQETQALDTFMTTSSTLVQAARYQLERAQELQQSGQPLPERHEAHLARFLQTLERAAQNDPSFLHRVIRYDDPEQSLVLENCAFYHLFCAARLLMGAGLQYKHIVGSGHGMDGKKISFGRQLNDAFAQGEAGDFLPLSMSESQLLKDFQEHHSQSLHQLTELAVNHNHRLVAWVARKYRYKSGDIPFADLLQQGMLGMKRAVLRFRPEEGNRLVTAGVLWIRARISHYIEENARSIRIPTYVQGYLRRIHHVRERITKQLGRPPHFEELASCVSEVSPQVLFQLLQVQKIPVSLDAPLKKDSESDLYRLLSQDDDIEKDPFLDGLLIDPTDQQIGSPEQEFQRKEFYRVFRREVIPRLDLTTWLIFSYYYGLPVFRKLTSEILVTLSSLPPGSEFFLEGASTQGELDSRAENDSLLKHCGVSREAFRVALDLLYFSARGPRHPLRALAELFGIPFGEARQRLSDARDVAREALVDFLFDKIELPDEAFVGPSEVKNFDHQKASESLKIATAYHEGELSEQSALSYFGKRNVKRMDEEVSLLIRGYTKAIGEEIDRIKALYSLCPTAVSQANDITGFATLHGAMERARVLSAQFPELFPKDFSAESLLCAFPDESLLTDAVKGWRLGEISWEKVSTSYLRGDLREQMLSVAALSKTHPLLSECPLDPESASASHQELLVKTAMCFYGHEDITAHVVRDFFGLRSTDKARGWMYRISRHPDHREKFSHFENVQHERANWRVPEERIRLAVAYRKRLLMIHDVQLLMGNLSRRAAHGRLKICYQQAPERFEDFPPLGSPKKHRISNPDLRVALAHKAGYISEKLLDVYRHHSPNAHAAHQQSSQEWLYQLIPEAITAYKLGRVDDDEIMAFLDCGELVQLVKSIARLCREDFPEQKLEKLSFRHGCKDEASKKTRKAVHMLYKSRKVEPWEAQVFLGHETLNALRQSIHRAGYGKLPPAARTTLERSDVAIAKDWFTGVIKTRDELLQAFSERGKSEPDVKSHRSGGQRIKALFDTFQDDFEGIEFAPRRRPRS